MGNTSGRGLHINLPLSNLAIQYKPEGMIADQLAPIVTVGKQADAYTIYERAEAYAIEDDARGPGAPVNRITRSATSATFFCNNYALGDSIPQEDIENADAGWLITERGSRVEHLSDKLSLGWEKRVGHQMTSGTNCGSYTAVGSAWTDHTAGNSDPIGNINTTIQGIQDMTGMRPNRMVMGDKAWRQFREHADVVDRIYGNDGTAPGARLVTQNNAAALFELDQVLIGGAYYNVNDEGQTVSLSQIWDDNVVLYYAPNAPRKDKPSAMYTFRWSPKNLPLQAQNYFSRANHAEMIDLMMYQDEKITAPDLMWLIEAVTSAT